MSANRVAYALIAAFIFFVTARGELRDYLKVMGLK